jgi:[acyl-carrier-protein] S-malonyltransferase
MGKIAFLFPGQGSQEVGMGKLLAEQNEDAKQLFAKADEVLNYPLSNLIFNGPQEELTLTENTQPALLTTSIAILTAFKEHGITADYTAGHSLGEYSALVAAGAISFEDAVYAVRQRGLFMEEAVPAGLGAMAAILGMERDGLKEITDSVTSDGESVELANLNCPGQIVISGTAKGVEIASKLAGENGAKRVIALQVSGPFHSALMKPASEKLSEVLANIAIVDAKVPVVANVTAMEMTSANDIRERLIQQLYSPVLWEDTIKYLLEKDVDTFIEIGPGKVLSGLVKKVHRRAKTYSISDSESLENVVAKLKGEA